MVSVAAWVVLRSVLLTRVPLRTPADNPEESTEKNGRSAILQLCLKQLSPAQREVIDLVYYHEKSVAEVAEIVDAPEKTVKTRM
jgi:RNA polymerase sigma-70 factor, ECF subfamily